MTQAYSMALRGSSPRTATTTRYVTPLREGGSVPAIVEADDDGTYVLKFRGAAQGPKALIAELVGGEIGRTLGLPVPEIVFAELDAAFSRNEPDPEIKALLAASAGLNLALDFLPGSMPFDPVVGPKPVAGLASAIVWFDAFITNVDRTARNTNMLVWHKELWLIDHGASLYFHHNWANYMERSRTPFAQIRSHVLLPYARAIAEADSVLRPLLTRQRIEEIISLIPESWLLPESQFSSPDEHRAAYIDYLVSRLEASAIFVQEAVSARAQVI